MGVLRQRLKASWVGDLVRRLRFATALGRQGVRPYRDFNRRFLRRGISLNQAASVYDRTWERFVDDCMKGDDLDRVLSALDGCETVLEVGSGRGRVSIAIGKTGRRVTATDISSKAIEIAAVAAADAGVAVEFLTSPAERLPFETGSFDAVVCCHTLEHVLDLEAAIAELERVANRRVVVTVPQEDAVSEYSNDFQFVPSRPRSTSPRTSTGSHLSACRTRSRMSSGRAATSSSLKMSRRSRRPSSTMAAVERPHEGPRRANTRDDRRGDPQQGRSPVRRPPGPLGRYATRGLLCWSHPVNSMPAERSFLGHPIALPRRLLIDATSSSRTHASAACPSP